MINRFMNKVDVDPVSECWEWNAGKNQNGYGQFWMDGKMGKAHRVSYELFRGPIPKGMHACHKCDNPGCVNPGHLFLGTAADNNRDRDEKGRNGSSNKTHCPQGHEYSDENTHVDRLGKRKCRACNREHVRKYRARKKLQIV